jgi:MFS transporter, YQGE family, putative transporter
MIANFIKNQKKAFELFNSDAKDLLRLNLMYHLVFPIIMIFVQAYLWGDTKDARINIIYTLGSFGGNYVGYMINAFLLRKISIKPLFYVGLILSVLPMVLIVYFVDIKLSNIVWFGLLFGIGTGIYWSCRNFLSYLVTNEQSRNFFAGVEQFTIITSNFITPFIFGFIIIGIGEKTGWYEKETVYQIGMGLALLMMFLTWLIIRRTNYQSPPIARFFYFKFHKIWNYQRFLSLFVGTVETGIYMLMALLILNVVGGESALGLIESLSTLFSALVVYFVSKKSKPEHRPKIILAGVISITLGGLIVGIEYSLIGVLGLKIFQIIADPLIHTAYRATWWSVIEKVSKIEKKSEYSYMLDTELFINIGRAIGGTILLVMLMVGIDINEGLRFIFLILGLLQFISFGLIKFLTKQVLDNGTN